MALNRLIPVPLYYQLVELLREQISAGVLPAGAQVPGERALSEQYGISRMTVRQAINYLVREGSLVAEHGRGTFVAAAKQTHDALHLLGFTEAMLQRGEKPRNRLLEQVIITLPLVAQKLALPEDSQLVRIVRLRFSDATPLLLETIYVPLHLFPDIEKADLEQQSLYHLFEQRYNVRPVRANQTLEATVANEYEQELFAVQPGMPMILLSGVTYDSLNRPIEQFKAVYRGDRFKLAYESERDAPSDSQRLTPRLSMVLAEP
jgi:GntR family transcriptional regulator